MKRTQIWPRIRLDQTRTERPFYIIIIIIIIKNELSQKSDARSIRQSKRPPAANEVLTNKDNQD